MTKPNSARENISWTVDQNMRMVRIDLDAKMRNKLSGLGESCATCKSFNRDKQHCEYKDKKVRAYNICPVHSVTRQDYMREVMAPDQSRDSLL